MQPKWLIRKASIDDAGGLQTCMQSAYARYSERIGDSRLPPMDLDYASEISNFPTWIVEIDDGIAGGLTMSFSEDHAHIANVAVHPNYQGQGLGRDLVRFAEVEAKQRGHSEIRLATHILLGENISLYHHLGWEEFSRDESRVYMKKNLA